MVMMETERLYLRDFIPQDSEDLFQMNADPEVLKYTGDKAFTKTEEAQAFIKNYIETVYYKPQTTIKTGLGRFAIVRKTDNTFLGWCGLKYNTESREVDLGYRLHKKYWRQGYATESAQACITYAFDTLKLPYIIARTHRDNTASQTLLDNQSFSYIKTITHHDMPSRLYHLKNKAYQLKEISAKETWPVRHPVLRKGRPLEDVYMEADEQTSTFHLGMFHNNDIIGVASFMDDSHDGFTGAQYRLRGMAVLPEYRRKGIAELLLKKGEALLKEKGKTLLWFNARVVALQFYKNLGYQVDGTLFDIPKVGPHYRMKKQLL